MELLIRIPLLFALFLTFQNANATDDQEKLELRKLQPNTEVNPLGSLILNQKNNGELHEHKNLRVKRHYWRYPYPYPIGYPLPVPIIVGGGFGFGRGFPGVGFGGFRGFGGRGFGGRGFGGRGFGGRGIGGRGGFGGGRGRG